MRQLSIALGTLAIAATAAAQDVPRPNIQVHDTWFFRHTVERQSSNFWQQVHTEASVVRVGADSLVVAGKDVGSTKPAIERLVGGDWSRSRSVNGHETIVNRPFLFPLTVGKTWDVQYAEDHPNREHKRESWVSHYRVVGWEEIEVPAGKFKALKVEAEGSWTAEREPRATSAASAQGGAVVAQSEVARDETATGRIYRAFWYVPEVKTFVKAIDENFSSNGERNERFTEELESYRVTSP